MVDDPKGAPKRKFADRYDTEEELEKGYVELMKKLDTQGGEVGTLRKQAETATAAAQQQDAYIKSVSPWMQALQGNPQIQQLLQNPQVLQQLIQGQQAATQTPADTSTDILTEAERQRIMQATSQMVLKDVLPNWWQQVAKGVEQWGVNQGRTIEEKMLANQKAANELYWRSMDYLAPEDKREALKQFHAKSLEYADPSKLDPMELASKALSSEHRITALEAENATMKKAAEEATAASLNSLGDPSGFFPAKDEKDTVRKGSDDIFRDALKDVEAEHGREGVSLLSGGLGR